MDTILISYLNGIDPSCRKYVFTNKKYMLATNPILHCWSNYLFSENIKYKNHIHF